jgi:hypothetical protein
LKKNLDEYLKYVDDNKDKSKLEWKELQRLLFEYCDENKCASHTKTKYKNQNIGMWLATQKGNINSIDDELYKKLSTNKYVKKNLDEYLNKKQNVQ